MAMKIDIKNGILHKTRTVILSEGFKMRDVIRKIIPILSHKRRRSVRVHAGHSSENSLELCHLLTLAAPPFDGKYLQHQVAIFARQLKLL